MTQPAGWYDDPQDPTNLRYFDGILWTDRVVPRTSPTAAASTIGRSTSPYAATPPATSGASPWGSAPVAPPGSAGRPYDAGNPYANPQHEPYGAPPPGYGYAAAPQLGWRPSGPVTPDGVPLAEWWQRLLAYLLDALILLLITLTATISWWLPIGQSYVDLFRQVTRSSSGAVSQRALDLITEQVAAAMVPMTLIELGIFVVYQVFFLTRSGATPGKMVLGIRVRRSGRPGPLTVLEALRRLALHIGLTLVTLVPFIGLLGNLVSILDPMWLLWDPRRQTLHDKVGDTLVEVKPKPLR